MYACQSVARDRQKVKEANEAAEADLRRRENDLRLAASEHDGRVRELEERQRLLKELEEVSWCG